VNPGKPSQTAIAAATARAGHLHAYEGAKILADDFALKLAGIAGVSALRETIARWPMQNPARVCAYFALRHRFCEDKLQEAIGRGVRQAVLLGAGLDSLALRRPGLARGIRLIEVDHPDSQHWKLARLAELGLSTPGVSYVPIDFANENLEQRLLAAGLELDRPVFVSWLGVTQYIERAANDATLGFVSSRPKGSEVVFDFIVRNELLDPEERALSVATAEQSAQRGEPWLTFFDPTELEKHLTALGFRKVERLTPRVAASRYYTGQPADVTPLEAWQVLSATV
jgi:methyltransferase (TIGR00027 family)